MTQAPDEREAIVRYLKQRAKAELDAWSSIQGNGCMEYADAWEMAAKAIERGDHISEQGEGYE